MISGSDFPSRHACTYITGNNSRAPQPKLHRSRCRMLFTQGWHTQQHYPWDHGAVRRAGGWSPPALFHQAPALPYCGEDHSLQVLSICFLCPYSAIPKLWVLHRGCTPCYLDTRQENNKSCTFARLSSLFTQYVTLSLPCSVHKDCKLFGKKLMMTGKL